MAWYKRRVNGLWLLWLASWRSLGAWLYQLDRAIFYYKESTGHHGRHFFLSVSSQYWPCVYPVLLRALPNATSLTIGTIINNNPSISLPSLGSCTCASHLSVFVPVSGIVYNGSHLAGGRIWCWSLAFRTKIPLLVGIYITLGYETLTKLSIGAWRLTYTRQALAHLSVTTVKLLCISKTIWSIWWLRELCKVSMVQWSAYYSCQLDLVLLLVIKIS